MAKFYAELSSERAQKKQIGNEYLSIDFFTGSRENSLHVATVRLYEDGNGNLRLATWHLETVTHTKLER